MKMRTLVVAISSIFIIGCSTGYHQENMFGGYSDSRLNANTAVVRFNGDDHTTYGQARTYVLYHAAQMTLNNGYDYFIVTSMTGVPMEVNVETSHDDKNGMTDPPKLYTTYYHPSTFRSYEYSYPQPIGCDNCVAKMHGVVAVIKMFQEPKPDGVPMAYDAKEVSAHMGPSTFN